MLRRLYVQVTIIFIFSLPTLSIAASGFIDTPDQCLAIDHVNRADVHLKRIGRCEGKPGRIFVEAASGEIRRIFVDGEFWRDQVVKQMEISDITGLLAKAEKQGSDVSIPDNPLTGAMQREADRANNYYTSPEFQETLQRETDRIKGVIFGDQLAAYYKESEQFGSAREARLANDERIYVFVSSSMPLHVLRTYAGDIARLQDPRVVMVMRGFVGGMEKIVPTMNLIAEVLKKESSCVLEAGKQCDMLPLEFIIDPLLFRRFGVNRVPAFVYARGVSISDPARSEGDTVNANNGYVLSVAGDASLKYVIGKFRDESGAKSLEGLLGRF